jgi:hypothetical protein
MRTRTIVGLAVGAVLLVLLVVAAVVGSGRSTTDYGPGTPEAAVQDYFQALIDNRPADTFEFYSTELADSCDRPYRDVSSPRVSRVVLDTATIDGARATVVVRITQRWDDGPLMNDEDTFTETLSLVNQDGRWVFDQVPWPYPCPPLPPARTTTTVPPTTATTATTEAEL